MFCGKEVQWMVAFAAATAAWRLIYHTGNGAAHASTQQSNVTQSLLCLLLFAERIDQYSSAEGSTCLNL